MNYVSDFIQQAVYLAYVITKEIYGIYSIARVQLRLNHLFNHLLRH